MNKVLRSVVMLAIIVALGMAALVAPAPVKVSAQSGSPTDLAKYFGADTVVYASIRTDDAYIQMWDDLLQKVLGKLPAGMVPAVSLRQQLVTALQSAGLDYEADVRSWLGDWAAFGANKGMLSNDSTATAMAVFSVKDRAKAEAFAEKLLAMTRSQFDKSTEGDFTAYRQAGMSMAAQAMGLLVGDDVAVLGNVTALGSLVTREAKLDQSADFTATVANLPEKSYNLLAYVDLRAVIATQMDMMRGLRGTGPNTMMEDAAKLTGPVAVGGTLLDGRSLVLDVAVRAGDKATLEALGMNMANIKPIKPTFAANLPANSSLVAHSTDLKGSYEMALKALGSAAKMQGMDEAKMQEQITTALRQIAGLTGIDLQADVISWLSGDYAIFASYEPPAIGTMGIWAMTFDPTTPVEFTGIEAGLVVEVTDTAKAAALVTKIDATLNRYLSSAPMVKLSQAQIGGGSVTVVSITTPQFTNPLELVVGSNDKVFVIATRKAGEAILNGQGGFDQSASFAEAGKYVLPNASGLLYASQTALDLIADVSAASTAASRRIFNNIVMNLQGTPTPEGPSATATAQAFRQEEMQQFAQIQTLSRTVAGIISTATISGSVTANGDTIVRMVLTLSE